jgi:Fic family protein
MPDELFPQKSPVGLHGLIELLDLKVPAPAVRSEVISGGRRSIIREDFILEQYPKGFLPRDITGHLRFAMRYEPIDLGTLHAVFAVLDQHQLEAWIRSEPTGTFARRAWYLYELLTGKTLDLPDVVPSGYIDLLDPDSHITGPKRLIRRQRINDNLLGNAHYCPLIRRSETIQSFSARNLTREAHAIVEQCDPAILSRAIHYLFTKETKSSFAIEGEEPSNDRTQRFIASLMNASSFEATNKEALVRLQNSIVDPRFAQADWRTTQNYVSRTLSNYTEDVHFVCPKPEDVPPLIGGWMDMVKRLEATGATDPVAAATAIGFGFVFLHPFEDGNGRIHRFLIHHALAKLGFTPDGILFPVSAAMLRNRAGYDRALERYSESILPFIDYQLDAQGQMAVRNQTVSLYRFADMTTQVEYLYRCIEETINRDLREEIGFLAAFDQALRSVMQIVDMPDRRASLLIRLIRQNAGKLSAAKRALFPELTDQEIEAIEQSVHRAWGQ